MNTDKNFQFCNRTEMFLALASRCAESLRAALLDRGTANFLVSGGSTPVPLFNLLSETQLRWRDITVALVDERWVPDCDDASNAKLVRQHLLQNRASEASFIPMWQEGVSSAAASRLINRQYRDEVMPMDLVILGMGVDGHTASLFPRAEGLANALENTGSTLCSTITALKSPVTGDHVERLTLTLSALVRAKEVILLFTGKDKKTTYKRALNNRDWSEMPVSAVLQHEKINVSVFSVT